MCDPLDYLDSDDLVSWLLLNPESAAEDLAVNSVDAIVHNNSLDWGSHGQAPSSSSSSSSSAVPAPTKPAKKRALSRVSSSASIASNASYSDDDDDDDNDTGSAAGSKPAKMDTSRRKMMKMAELENKIKRITKENEELNAHVLNVQRRHVEVHRQRAKMEKEMGEKVALQTTSAEGERQNEQELFALLQQYSTMYSDYGEMRKKEVAFHLDQLEKLLIPTQTTKMCLWAMQQDKSFYSPDSAIYNIFCNEIGVTGDLSMKMLERRDHMIELTKQLTESLSLIKLLRTAIDDKHTKFDACCTRVKNVGSAKQQVAFLLWITRNADKLSRIIPDFWRSLVPGVNEDKDKAQAQQDQGQTQVQGE